MPKQPFLHETKLIKFQHSETETQALHSGTHGPIYHRRSLFHLGQILRQDLLLMGLQSGLWLTQERHTYQKKKSSKPMHVVQGYTGCLGVGIVGQALCNYGLQIQLRCQNEPVKMHRGVGHAALTKCAQCMVTWNSYACAPQSMCAIGSLNTTPPPLPFCIYVHMYYIQYILHVYMYAQRAIERYLPA